MIRGSRIKVLTIEPAGKLWGSERALLDLIESASDLDFAVCCPPDSPIEEELRSRKIQCYPYFIASLHQKTRWRRLQAAIGVLRACKEFRPDIIHLNQAGSYRVAVPAARMFGIPIVAHVRMFEDAAYLARTRESKPSVALIAISHSIAGEIGKHAALADVPVEMIYDAYRRRTPVGTPSRDGLRLTCAGRITPSKGQDILLDALSSATEFPGPVECIIAGDGETAYLQELKAREESTGAKIVWTGFIEDLGEILQRSAVLVVPSHHEALGRVIFEAWDAGSVPVVFGGSGGAAEVISASGGGILYSTQTPAALSEAIQTAFALDEHEVACMIGRGRDWLDENCSPSTYGRAIFKVFEEASHKV